jgi:predicted glutamine amidotransferase
MCRMLGKVALFPFNPTYELLDAVHGLEHQSKCSKQPDDPRICGPHASGCGIAWREDHRLLRERRSAEDRWDETFKARIRSLTTTGIIAHNRLASPGLRVDVTCSHPFIGEKDGLPIALCHNGGIYSFFEQAEREGVSDSAILLEKIIEEAADLSHETLARLFRAFSEELKYTCLNTLLLTPSALHLFRCFDSEAAQADRFDEYYTLYVKQQPDSLTVASEPVDAASDWTVLPNRTLVSVETNGQLSIKQSTFSGSGTTRV